MSIFAIGDLHLAMDPRVEKPMDIFGEEWVDHAEKLKTSWLQTVSPGDTVIICGDISWGLRLEEARADFEWLRALPGKKLIFKGNHDLWWTSVTRLNRLYDMIDMVIANQTLRIATGVLNEIMTEAVAMQQPPSDKGKRLKLYYITQVSVKPPTFVIFVNDKELMHFSYTRYLENKIREAFGFRGTPLRFIIRERKEKER